MPIDRKKPSIIVDTREKRPLNLEFTGCKILRNALSIGDYSIYGYGQLVVVEYKSLTDWLKWISYSDHKRFERQVHNLITIPYRCIVVGGRLGSVCGTIDHTYAAHSKEVALERTAQVTAMGIPVIFCSGRIQAARFTYKFLQEGVKLCH